MQNFWLQRKSLIAMALSLLALAEIVDMTIVAVAIPRIMGSIGANIQTIADVTTTYIVFAAIFIMLSGLVIEKYGIKKVALISSLLFAGSSIMCGQATSLPEMIIFRAFQGIGGAFLPALPQTYISVKFKGEEFNKMIALYSMVVVMGPVLGPILGGAITENLSWRWIFYINVPICLIAFIVIFLLMEKVKVKNVKIDYVSFGFMAIGIGCLELFIDNGNNNDWFNSMAMILLLATAIIFIFFFIWRGIIYSSVVKLFLFNNRNFLICCFLVFTFLILYTGALSYFPTMLQNIYGYPVDLAGYITAPRGVAAIITSFIIQKYIIKKFDLRLILSLGILIFAAGSLMQGAFSTSASKLMILVSTGAQGAGLMMFFIPYMRIIRYGIADQDMGDMSGIYNFFRNFGSSVGTAIVATFVTRSQQTQYQNLVQNVSDINPNFKTWIQQIPAESIHTKLAIVKQEIIYQGGLLSYVNSYYLIGIVSIVLAIVPFLLKAPPRVNTHKDKLSN